VSQFTKLIDDLLHKQMDPKELEDEEAEALQKLVETKRKEDEDVVTQTHMDEADAEEDQGGDNVIDLMAVLRKSLAKNAVVKNATGATPISFEEHRAKRAAKQRRAPKKVTRSKKRTKKKVSKT
jgi:non-homologous end joining protein Ku